MEMLDIPMELMEQVLMNFFVQTPPPIFVKS